MLALQNFALKCLLIMSLYKGTTPMEYVIFSCSVSFYVNGGCFCTCEGPPEAMGGVLDAVLGAPTQQQAVFAAGGSIEIA